MSSEETEKSLRSEIDGYLHGRLNALQEEVSRLQGYINRAFSDLLEQSARPADDDNTVTSAIAQYLRASHQQGVAEGLAQGIPQGIEQGVAQGMAQAIAEAAAEAAKNKLVNESALLSAAIAEIDDQRSQSDILNALINRAAVFAPRAVFFIVRQDHAQGWRGRGLENTVGDEAARRISLSLADEHAVSAAARTQSLWSGAPDDHAQNYLLVNALGGDLPQRIAALPLVVRSKTVAVLYADSAALDGDALKVEALETLVRVAGMAVELLAVTRGTPRPSAVAQPAAAQKQTVAAVAPPPAPVSQPVAAVVVPPPAPTVTVANPPPAPPVPTPEPTPTEAPVPSPVFVAEKTEPATPAPPAMMAEVPESVEFTPPPAPPEPVAAAPVPAPPAPVVEEVVAPVALPAPPAPVAEEVVAPVALPAPPAPVVEEVVMPEPPAPALEAEEVPAADADQPYYAAYQPDAPDAAVPVADAAPTIEAEAAPAVEVEAAPEKVFSFSTPSVPVFETTYTPPAPVTYTPPASEPTPVHSTWQWPTVMANTALPVPETPPAPERPSYQPPAPESYASPVPQAYTPPAPEPFTPPAPETFTVPPAPETFAPPPSPFSRPTGPLGSARTYGREIELPISVGEDERRLHNDARRFARLLVSEIKLYNEPKVREGRQAQDIYVRLRDAIDRSRQMYERRVAAPVASRFDYFHYELVNTLAEGDVGKLGADYPGAAI